MKKYFFIIVSFTLLFALSALAEDAALLPWKYYKDIKVEEDTDYKSFFLDEEVYQHSSQGLRDIRIVNEQNEFVEFYLDNIHNQTPEVSIYPTQRVEVVKIKNDTKLTYRLKPLHDKVYPTINKLSLFISDDNFYKHVKVEVSLNNFIFQTIATDVIYKVGKYIKTDILLPANFSNKNYRLVIEDNTEGIIIDSVQAVYDGNEAIKAAYEKTITLPYDFGTDSTNVSFNIHNKNRLKINKLVIDLTGKFDCRYSVSILDESNNHLTIKEGVLSGIQYNGKNYSDTVITFPEPINATKIFLNIEKAGRETAEIKGVYVTYCRDKLIFKKVEYSRFYRLYFDNPAVDTPTFSLVKDNDHIALAELELCKLGKLSMNHSPGIRRNHSQDFIYEGLVLMAIIFLTTSAMRRKSFSRKTEPVENEIIDTSNS